MALLKSKKSGGSMLKSKQAKPKIPIPAIKEDYDDDLPPIVSVKKHGKSLDMDSPLSLVPSKKSKTKTTDVSTVKVSTDVKAGIELLFGPASLNILNMLRMDDTESGITLAQKQLLITTLSMIPQVEAAVKGSSGKNGVYQYVQLAQAAQSQIEAIKSQLDVQLVADSINTNQVDPVFIEITQHIMNSIYRFHSELKDTVPDTQRKFVGSLISDTIRSVASCIDDKRKELKLGISARIGQI